MFEIWVSDLPRTEVCHFPQRQHCSDQASTECTARHPLSQPSSKLNYDKLRNRKTWLKNTNLWAVRMSVQVHKLTNLKNGIESHTSSWEMWRQQIWLLNKPRISNQAGPLGDSDMLPGRPRILQLHETKNSGHEIAQPHLSQVFLHALPPLLSKVPTTISPKTTAADATWIHAIHWEKATLHDHKMSLTESTLSVLVR